MRPRRRVRLSGLGGSRLEIDEDALLAEIPDGINRIMAQDMELALDWVQDPRAVPRLFREATW
jgi:hypothetical protein